MTDFIIKLLFLAVFIGVFYGGCAVVHSTLTRPGMRYVVLGAIGTIGVLILMLGLLSLAAPKVVAPKEGTLLLLVGGAMLLPLFRVVRRFFALFSPLDPASTIDTAGLVVLFLVLVLAGVQLFTLDTAAFAQQVNVTVTDSLLNAIGLPLIGLSLVGVFITRDWRASVRRLGLARLTVREIAIAVALVAPLLAADQFFNFLGRQLQPAEFQRIDVVLRAMSANVTNPLIALIIALAAGFGEEILFRGAIQPRLGILLTTLAFAAAHVQYGPTIAIAAVFTLGLVFAWERKSINTTAAIVTHTAYNVVALLVNAWS